MDLNRGAASTAAEPPSAQAHDDWSPASPASLFARPLPRAQVIFKKRRLPTLSPGALEPATHEGASPDTAARTAAADGSRAPRVFTTRRCADPTLEARPASGLADTAPAPIVPLRRRRPAAHSPGKVVRVVMREDAGATATAAAWFAASLSTPAGASAATPMAEALGAPEPVGQDAQPGFERAWPDLREHQAVLAALSTVSRLLEEAAAASRWRF